VLTCTSIPTKRLQKVESKKVKKFQHYKVDSKQQFLNYTKTYI
jgi:hypothetical protein